MSRKEVIVCVDDEEGVLRVLRAQLGARFGHECQIATARSGDEAVALFDELTREGEQIALVIADQIMPGMKGAELLEIVDRRLPTTTKVLLTGQAGLDAVIDAINRAHLHHYIAKPWDETTLLLVADSEAISCWFSLTRRYWRNKFSTMSSSVVSSHGLAI